MSMEQTDNAQGTLAATAGALLGAGIPAAVSATGTTQYIGLALVAIGAGVAIIRAYLRSP